MARAFLTRRFTSRTTRSGAAKIKMITAVLSAPFIHPLRWRCGEYQALFRLTDSAKDRVVPFVVIPEIEFDFEEWRPKKTVQQHVAPFAKRYHQKWGNRPAWVDVHPKIISLPMDNGKPPTAHVFDELRLWVPRQSR
jgi:Beta protein